MKDRITTIGLLALPILGLLFMSYMPRVTGSPGGKTGSPGDEGSTCNQCHSSTVKAKEGWISSDIPEEGYIAGETYTITLSAQQAGITRFGFELTTEKAGGDKIGSFDIEDNTQMQLVNNSAAVTHTSSGIAATDGARSWSFKWTAPVAGTGEVSFYAAINAANADGGTSGDAIFTTEVQIDEQIDNSIELFILEGWLKVYPNPAIDRVFVHMNGLTPQSLEFNVYDLQGQLIKSDMIEISAANSVISIPVEDLPTGNYIVHFEGLGVNLKGKFLVVGR
ncbi:MAG: choice-of-anchor V domain-containing protein [Bacteroidota bacterium]|nr:choice-of-anchor V domain-containing protein [Bacteroidota bacterium]